jgi:protein-disulfide isomerase
MPQDTPKTDAERSAERRRAAREARSSADREADGAAARRRRLTQLGALLGVAVAVVAIAIAVSSGGGSSDGGGQGAGSGGDVAGSAEVAELFGGIPQDRLVLGRAGAPVTMVEFVDPQCPFCREYALNEMPALIDKYVRTGKLRMELRTLSFIGPDSVKAAKVINAAARQDKAWNVEHLLYYNQGKENSGYVTDEFLRSILAAVPGLDVERVLRDAETPEVAQELGAANTLASRYAADSTPSFVLGRTGGTLRRAEVDPTAAALGARIDALLERQGT